MPPDQQPGSSLPSQTQSGTPPAQTPTGEIKDQSLLTQDQGTTKPGGEGTKTNEDQSLLNQDAKPTVDTKATKPDPTAKPTIPDKYEFTLPEGFEVSEDATTLFKELGLDNPGAQKLVDFHLAKQEAAAQAPYDLWKETQENWVKEIKADPEIGGKLDQVRATTAKAIDSLGPELAKSFREALNFTGAGNNPTFVKAFYRFSQQLTEGTHVPAGGPVTNKPPGESARPSAANALYPNLKG